MSVFLGLASSHDASACVFVDGRLAAAVSLERVTRRKNDGCRLPLEAMRHALEIAGVAPARVDGVATIHSFFPEKFFRRESLAKELEARLVRARRRRQGGERQLNVNDLLKRVAPRGKDIAPYFRRADFLAALGLRPDTRVRFVDHHATHAMAAAWYSGFDDCAVLTIDGVGELNVFHTESLWSGGQLERTAASDRLGASPGEYYEAITEAMGFIPLRHEGKVLGLAAHGDPSHLYADFARALRPNAAKDGFESDFTGRPDAYAAREAYLEALVSAHPREHVAAAAQAVFEDAIVAVARSLLARTGRRALAVNGGVFANVKLNQRLAALPELDRLFVFPAMSDTGNSVGAALFLVAEENPAAARPTLRSVYWGGRCEDEACARALAAAGFAAERLDEDALVARAADAIHAGRVVGWFQGRMEFGPRALGARSIIGDPRNSAMQTVMNVKVKFREGFRPFAPAVLREHAHEYFDVAPGIDAPYMLLVAPVHPAKRERVSAEDLERRGIDKLKVRRSSVPAITHVDYSARLQTVDERHGLYRTLIESFYRKTGCPVIVNTSFNLGWDPIVNTPREAYETFMSCDMDALVMGHFVLTKSAQRSWTGAAGPAPGPGRAARGGPVSARAVAAPDAVVGTLWWSPCCHADLSSKNGHAACAECGRTFSIEDGIPLLALEREGGETKAASERAPRPNYDDLDSVRALIAKMRQDPYARALNESAPYNRAVLEVGCGTGQLTNFLGVSCRTVVGTDISLDSLRLAERFRSAHGLNRVRFVQTDPSHPVFKPEQFDVILQNGAPGGSGDAIGALKSLVQMLRPGGHLMVGLYNTYGRILPDLRRMFGAHADGRAWLADGRDRAGRSTHTVGEVLGWFRECGLDFVRSEPAAVASRDEGKGKRLLEPVALDGSPDSIRMRARQFTSGGREGGYFLMVGRKPGDPGARTATVRVGGSGCASP